MRRLFGPSGLLLALLCACFITLPGPPPATAAAKLAGCPVFPPPPKGLSPRASSLPTLAAWNQDISRAPVARGSRRIIRFINRHGGNRLHPGFGSDRAHGIPFRIVGPRQRRFPVRYVAYGFQSDRGPFPIPMGAPIQGGRRAGGDRHVIVMQRRSCKLFELYRAFPRRGRRGPFWQADSGARWSLRSARHRADGWTSADAAGLPILPGLVRYGEVRRGRIDHAIRVTFSVTRDARIRPATHCAGRTHSGLAPAMGMRLRMRRNYPIGHLRGAAAVIARAMKRYGLIVADNGSNWHFHGAPDRRWDDEDLDQLKSIPGSAFEVVRSAARPKRC